MSTLSEILTQHSAELAEKNNFPAMLIPEANGLNDLLEKYHWTNLEYVGAGSQSIVVMPSDTKDYVIRITSELKRSVIPHTIQPIFQKLLHPLLNFEIVPNIAAPEEDKQLLLPDFRAEVKNSGYLLGLGKKKTLEDFGIFKYGERDPETQKQPEVMMAADGGAIMGNKPTCTTNYPTLDVQWQEQCKLVAQHPELQDLLRDHGFPDGLPARLPDTAIVSGGYASTLNAAMADSRTSGITSAAATR